MNSRTNVGAIPKNMETYPDNGQSSTYQKQPSKQFTNRYQNQYQIKKQPMESFKKKPLEITQTMEEIYKQPILDWSNNIPGRTNADWDIDFRQYIYYLIYQVFNNEQKKNITDPILMMMVSPENMEIWKKAVTHESYDRINNYENLEFVGDKELHSGFTRWLLEKDPNLSKSKLTNYDHYYMTTHFQPKLTELYKLDKWVRMNGVDTDSDIDTKIKEDLYESFNGALEIISRNIYNQLIISNNFEAATYVSPGDVVYKNVRFVFEYVNLNEKFSKGAGKTTVLEILKALGMPDKPNQANFNYTTNEILLTQDAVNLFKNILGISIKNSIGKSTINSDAQIITMNSAWDNAASYLVSLGFNEDWLSDTQYQNKWYDVPVNLLENAKNKAKLSNINKLAVLFSGTSEEIIGHLLGYKQESFPQILITTKGKEFTIIKINLLSQYINS